MSNSFIYHVTDTQKFTMDKYTEMNHGYLTSHAC